MQRAAAGVDDASAAVVYLPSFDVGVGVVVVDVGGLRLQLRYHHYLCRRRWLLLVRSSYFGLVSVAPDVLGDAVAIDEGGGGVSS